MSTFTGADKAIGFLFEMAANIAADYDSTATYAQGSYTIYAGTLYKCTTAISTPEAFTPAKWQAVLIMNEVAAGGGTTVVANPAGQATDTLNKLQVGATIYDVPSGGGSSGHAYSTTEQIIGTWIDGSTLYEKTYDTGQLPNNTNKDIAHGVTNLGHVISLVGFAERPSDNTKITLPLVNGQNISYQIETSVRGDNIRITTRIDRTNFTISYMTMQYTKTS